MLTSLYPKRGAEDAHQDARLAQKRDAAPPAGPPASSPAMDGAAALVPSFFISKSPARESL